jgi:thioredoxin reductase
MDPLSPVADVLIIGGSHAGLSAALTLYRALHTTIIFDDHKPRNWYPSSVHLMPTWEHQSPDKLREASKAELQDSGLCTFVDATVQRAERLSNELFQVADANNSLWIGRKILVTTGMKDIFPDLGGYTENYPQRMSVTHPFHLIVLFSALFSFHDLLPSFS